MLREMEGCMYGEDSMIMFLFFSPYEKENDCLEHGSGRERSFRHLSPRGGDDRSRLAISSGGSQSDQTIT